MPANRLLDPRCGHSQKVSLLTDLEYRVWTQYILSADDFGVMLDGPSKLQADNRHLRNRKAKDLQRCLDALVKCGLLRRFEHQGQSYVCQHDWQDWQKVTWPSKTIHPCPPTDLLQTFSEWTRLLFSVHPGAKKAPKKPEESSSEVLQSTAEELSLSRARVGAERLTANANGSGLTANGGGVARPHPIIARRRLDAAYEHESGLYVPNRAHQDLLPMHGGREQELFDWYPAVCAAWAGRQTGTDMIRFWKARHDETWPPEAAPTKAQPAWLQRAQAAKAAQS